MVGKIFEIIDNELNRQRNNVELIASENFVSLDVMKAQGSVLTNKYAEGYPGKRYYGGCDFVDEVENIARDELKRLFDVKFVNVQPHSGSAANMAVYKSLLNIEDKVLGMDLSAGGHLTHGYSINFSGLEYNIISYGVDKDTECIDYDEVEKLVILERPKMIIAGASAYSRIIDFKRFREIADKVDAYLMVDMSHIAGLVAAGLHPNPCKYAHVVTSTTHKTLRGPRGGIVLTNDEDIAKKIDKMIFPGIQGGPLMHVIAAKAVCFAEALDPSFVVYQHQVVNNAKALSERLKLRGLRIVTGGTDNHLVLVDVTSLGINGKEAEKILDGVNITCNKNSIPFDTESPFKTSGIRLGTPAMTTRGFKEEEFEFIADCIVDALENRNNVEVISSIKDKVLNLLKKFNLY